jgi:hypothetical protein
MVMTKYYVSENFLVKHNDYKYIVFMIDIVFWAKYLDECLAWMKKTFEGDFHHEGMVIYVKLESDLTMFCLRF